MYTYLHGASWTQNSDLHYLCRNSAKFSAHPRNTPVTLILCLQLLYVTEFWKITLMVAPETIRIFGTSMVLLIAESTF